MEYMYLLHCYLSTCSDGELVGQRHTLTFVGAFPSSHDVERPRQSLAAHITVGWSVVVDLHKLMTSHCLQLLR